MAINYSPTNWQNSPSTETPITADALNNIETGISAAVAQSNANATAIGQLSLSGDITISQLLLMCYPVGSLYYNKTLVDPANLFGGTWKRIKDKMIMAAGDTYVTNQTLALSNDNYPTMIPEIVIKDDSNTKITFKGIKLEKDVNFNFAYRQTILANNNFYINNIEANGIIVYIYTDRIDIHINPASGSGLAPGCPIENNIVIQTSQHKDFTVLKSRFVNNGVAYFNDLADVSGGALRSLAKNQAPSTKGSFQVRRSIAQNTYNTVGNYNYYNIDDNSISVKHNGDEWENSLSLTSNSGASNIENDVVTFDNGGESEPINILPPYKVYYCWERIA